MLDRGDAAVMTTPEARFDQELERMKLVAAVHAAIPGTNHPRQTLEAEIADLSEALRRMHVTVEESSRIVGQHRAERQKMAAFTRVTTESAATSSRQSDGTVFLLRPPMPSPTNAPAPMSVITPGLPGEFADYFRGSIAWSRLDFKSARQAWIDLLARPPTERYFKSTWAAFMLGKSWEDENHGQARRYFQMVRSLATNGFRDTLGLAAASLGWEARGYYQDGDFSRAIDLYLEQAAGGDPTAVISLRWVAARALRAPPRELEALAVQPRAQRVITAYLISGGFRDGAFDIDSYPKEKALQLYEWLFFKVPRLPAPNPAWHHFAETVSRWLTALEEAQVTDAESVEQIALAAYQDGQMDIAQRWLDRARSTPVAQWLRAKLLLRAGQTEQAAALFAALCQQFPVERRDNQPLVNVQLVDNLFVKIAAYENISVAAELHGELAVFQVARRQYAEALAALLESGYWMDAAYVAERVLTLDELKAFVDRNYPPAPPSHEPVPRADVIPEPVGLAALAPEQRDNAGNQIRYLLGRRLVRAGRWSEARGYYPPEWLGPFDQLSSVMRVAKTPAMARDKRAMAYLAAAKLTRQNGLELLGTEVEPDWRIHAGDFEEGVSIASRVSLQNSNRLAATSEELERARKHAPLPEQRWHYRYTAAALAWEAAELMPDNSPETARALGLAGTWLKSRDPKNADVFYKALVRRCRRTPLGAEAERRRWFPPIDENGDMLPIQEQDIPKE